jgi:hypothetical protein
MGEVPSDISGVQAAEIGGIRISQSESVKKNTYLIFKTLRSQWNDRMGEVGSDVSGVQVTKVSALNLDR